ncbi:MAG TPA: hypothetical protein ENJ24_03110 [Gammaproteobacteria bacterium]|nr:hypothetical protein [Gammaproteobacteria bacterium]
MNCEQLHSQLDNYLDGELSAELHNQAETHISGCESCRAAVAEAREIQEALRQIPAPPMRPGFASQAIKHAVNQHSHHRRGFVAGFSTALAASLVLALFIGGLLPDMEQSPESGATPAVLISMQQPQTVNLVFDVATAMENATLSIVLPDSVEVVGFPGQHEITWQTSLQAGRNILPLPLKGIMHSNSTVVASIEQDGKKKSIRIPIEVNDGKVSPQVELTGSRIA